MLSRLKKAVRMAWFNQNTRSVLDTPPAPVDPASRFVLFSQVCHADLYMYLLAAKTFASRLRPRQIVMMDDGSLTAVDRAILGRHISGAKFVHVDDVPNTRCPKGMCWERLLFVADTAATDYIIQLDADTLTVGPLDDVAALIASDTGFTLGSDHGTAFVPMVEAAAFGRGLREKGSRHVQAMAESSLDRFPGHERLRYVRGCAGFAGYPRGSISRARVEEFSQRMTEFVGREKWETWGADQVTSNYLIANAPKAVVLPLSSYDSHQPGVDLNALRFIHFIGTYRFDGGTYVAQARRLIRALAPAS